MPEYEGARPGGSGLAVRAGIVVVATALLACGAHAVGFDGRQVLSASVFLVTVFATLLFWRFRLAIAFLGIATLLACRVLTLETFVESCELPVILFLVGMMITVGVLKELGFFSWIIQTVVNMKRMTGPVFTVTLVVLSALMACLVDEVTSIVFVCALVFQVCDTLKVRPLPFVIIAVMATNIGSAGTMLGNPVGLLIGHNAQLGFADFVLWAFPVMLISLAVTLGLLFVWYRREIAELSRKLEQRRARGLRLGPLVKVPYRRGLAILVGMLAIIALHQPLESLLNLAPNTVLLAAPLAVAGGLMVWRHDRARHYVENNVEWWTLLFFMMLFAKAGTLEYTGVTDRVAAAFTNTFEGQSWMLTPVIMFTSALGSAFVDNVVFVAAFIPVVKELGAGLGQSHPFWWALLFGACFGGNITMIGSTANIVALGMMEKRYRTRATFLEWLKVGLLTGLTACVVAWLCLLVTGPLMLREPRGGDIGNASLTGDELGVLKNWPRKDDSPEKAAQVGAICLRHRLSKRRVTGLIGEPTSRHGTRILYYDFAPSQSLDLHFDEKGTVSRAYVSGMPVRPDGTLAREGPVFAPDD